MKKINALTSALLALTLLVTVSCSKDDDATPDKMALATAHKWKFSTVENAGPLAAVLNELYKGSTYTFKSDGTYSAELGDAFPGLTDSGTWEFAENESKFILDKGTADATTYTIVTLNDGTFSLKDDTLTYKYVK